MKFYVKYIIFLLLFPTIGCVKEDEIEGIDQKSVNFEIKMNALDMDIKVRIIIVDATTREILSNESNLNLSSPYTKKVRVGKLNIYIFGNEFNRISNDLSALTNESELLNFTIEQDELPDFEDPTESSDASNLPLMKKVPVTVRLKDPDTEMGEVSTDDGKTWSQTLNVSLDRLAVRINLEMRKHTPNESDVVIIEKVQLINSPLYAYWIPQTYKETDFYAPQYIYNDDDGIAFTKNEDINRSDNYLSILDQPGIIPEYIPVNPYDENKATTLKILARYDGQETTYLVPLRNEPGSNNFSLERNSYHIIKATIVSDGEIALQPEVGYQVLDWDEAYNPFEDGKSVIFGKGWVGNPNINGKDIYVTENDILEFKFTLARPHGATWTATLTNSVDFMFDYSGEAVSSGIANENLERIIRIVPRKGIRRNNVKTEFYITINYGNENVELDLINGNVGSENRYIINQIPID